MPNIVVDTNVWVMADRVLSLGEDTPFDEAACIEACYNWLNGFSESADKLLVDLDYRVMAEYRSNVTKGGLAEQELNRLESQPLARLMSVSIVFDGHGHAELPDDLTIADESDRKFVALAISQDPYAPIYNATDTDWGKAKSSLTAYGLAIHELCQAYIDARAAAF